MDCITYCAFAAFLLVGFSKIYKRQLVQRSKLRLTEKEKRSLGQVSGYSVISENAAHHGIVLDENTGHYYAQHRHHDSELKGE